MGYIGGAAEHTGSRRKYGDFTGILCTGWNTGADLCVDRCARDDREHARDFTGCGWRDPGDAGTAVQRAGGKWGAGHFFSYPRTAREKICVYHFFFRYYR